MRTKTLILASLFVGFTFTGCGPSAAEKRAQQVADAKDDALKLRQQLAQAKTGAEAETSATADQAPQRRRLVRRVYSLYRR